MSNKAKAKPKHGEATASPCNSFAHGEVFRTYEIRFLKETKNIPLSKLYFFTFKDNSGRYHKMDKVRKWCSKWASHYIIVRSPEGGIHFHGIGVKSENLSIRYLKGIHLRVSPLGDKKEPLSWDRDTVIHETHPLIYDYEMSVRHMCVMDELRQHFKKSQRGFNCPMSSLTSRIKSRKARLRRAKRRTTHVERTLGYLEKNFFEGAGIPFDDIVCR